MGDRPVEGLGERTVSELLGAALRRSGLTARETARRAGIGEGRLSDYLSGRHDPGASRMLRLLRATGHDIELVAIPGQVYDDRLAATRTERNGLLLAELFDLGDALTVSPRPGVRRRARPDPPLFRDLVVRRG